MMLGFSSTLNDKLAPKPGQCQRRRFMMKPRGLLFTGHLRGARRAKLYITRQELNSDDLYFDSVTTLYDKMPTPTHE